MDDLIREFLVESHENLDELDRDFVGLEKDPTSREILARVFRTIHTIKGTCGFLGYKKLEELTHVGENLLSLLRDGKLMLDSTITTALLSLVDGVREMLGAIESTGEEGDGDYSDLIVRLTALKHAAADGDNAARQVAEPQVAEPQVVEPIVAAPADSRGVGALTDRGLRVDVQLLDNLMNLVGELVLARNQILQSPCVQDDPSLTDASQRLNLITTELQEGVMKTRMQPIDNIWSKLPRVVRDLAMSCGKEVRIDMAGKGTELDKTLLEAIKDPLTHIVRNAVDHGFETPDVREAAGKSREGCLTLHAFHEGGQVHIEVRDDGGGIDPARVRTRAIERGLLSADQASRMTDREIVALVFAPGFSTATAVTNVSGRGVGMDVVKTNIERIGGSVDVHSEPGEGTTLKIKIPLTLAIIPALIVTCGGARYAIPQVSLLELVRVEAGHVAGAVEKIHGAPVYRLRGNLLPLVYLDAELAVAAERDGDAPLNIVVLQAGERSFGLVVNEIVDTQEIVVKPLGALLQRIDVFAGATIMGDGKVALILDALGIARRSGVISEGRGRAVIESRLRPAITDTTDQETLLLVSTGSGNRMAVPLSSVARLEEFEADVIERVGDRSVVQYRGRILPLYTLSSVYGGGMTIEGRERIHVVVYSEGDRSMGLVVDEILDIVVESVSVEEQNERSTLLGAAVVAGQVTELIDLRKLASRIDPTFFEVAAGAI